MEHIFLDGDFPSNKGSCEHHCSPSCHPAQIGPDWVYGCLHEAWPQNKAGDFVPIVNCKGIKGDCELIGQPFVNRYRGGLKRRVKNAMAKADKYCAKIIQLDELAGRTTT